MEVNNTIGIDIAMDATKANIIRLVAFVYIRLLADYIIYRDLVSLHYKEVFS